MPRNERTEQPTDNRQYVMPSVAEEHHPPTLERQAFVNGLFNELSDQLQRYLRFTEQRLELEARMSIVERNLRLTREHLYSILEQTDEEVPPDWRTVLGQVRFVGARLGDACVELLREAGTLKTQQLLDKLNRGQFRFRSGSPLREINAALLRQPRVRREGDTWFYEDTAKGVA